MMIMEIKITKDNDDCDKKDNKDNDGYDNEDLHNDNFFTTRRTKVRTVAAKSLVSNG